MLGPFGLRRHPVMVVAVMSFALFSFGATETTSSLLGVGLIRATWAANVIASQEAQISGVVAEIIQCRRKEGILTIHMKLRNTTADEIKVDVIGFQSYGYSDYYVMAGGKKYTILRDSDNVPLAPSPTNPFGGLTVKLSQNEAWTWWAKYPAPPSDVTTISYYTPLTLSFDDLQIAD